jgi:hypothetical protein
MAFVSELPGQPGGAARQARGRQQAAPLIGRTRDWTLTQEAADRAIPRASARKGPKGPISGRLLGKMR